MSDASADGAPIEPDRMPELSSFQRDLLFVLAGSDAPSGQEVKAELEDSTDESILPGQLYPNLDELHDRGLVRKEDRDGRTNQYVITEQGRQVLAEVCRWQHSHVGQAVR